MSTLGREQDQAADDDPRWQGEWAPLASPATVRALAAAGFPATPYRPDVSRLVGRRVGLDAADGRRATGYVVTDARQDPDGRLIVSMEHKAAADTVRDVDTVVTHAHFHRDGAVTLDVGSREAVRPPYLEPANVLIHDADRVRVRADPAAVIHARMLDRIHDAMHPEEPPRAHHVVVQRPPAGSTYDDPISPALGWQGFPTRAWGMPLVVDPTLRGRSYEVRDKDGRWVGGWTDPLAPPPPPQRRTWGPCEARPRTPTGDLHPADTLARGRARTP